MSDKLIQWTLTIAQADQIINALYIRPYGEVAVLIPMLLKQANVPVPTDRETGLPTGQS